MENLNTLYSFKILKMNIRILLLFLGLSFCLNYAKAHNNTQKGEFVYVLHPEGLDLHKSPVKSSEILRHLPYGSKLKLVKSATTINLKIDRIEAGMAEVTYNGKIGYIFEGYISKFPAPKEITNYATYITSIRENKVDVYYEDIRKDWGKNKYERTFSINLPTTSWAEAFIVAQQLFDIPERVFVPVQWDEPNEQKQYSNELEELAKEFLSLSYDEKGYLGSMTYQYDGIMDDQTVTLTIDEEKELIKVKEVRNIKK